MSGEFNTPSEMNEGHIKRVFNFNRQAIGNIALVIGLTMGSFVTDAEVVRPGVAAAEDGGYPYADMPCLTGSKRGQKNGTGVDWCPGYSWGDLRTGNEYSERKYSYRNCTDWAAYRATKLTGKSVPTNLGDAKDWNDNAPRGWNIDNSPEPGDIAQSELPARYGHVGVVESVDKDINGKITKIIVSEYNKGADGNYGRYDYFPDNNGKFPRGAGGRMWDHFLDLNGVGKGIDGKDISGGSTGGEAAPKVDNTVKRVIKKNAADGSNLIFWAKSGSVFESWYKPGGDGVHHTNIAEITQQDVRDIDVQLNADGQRLVYTATPHNILETNYYPGQGIKSAGIIHDDAEIKKVLKSKDPDGSEQLYVLTDGGVDEYEWHPGGAIDKRRIFTLRNPVDMEKSVAPDGTQELYVADSSHVYENIWKGDGAVKEGTAVLHIPQTDITDIDFSRDSDNTHRVYAGRRQSGVWEASWKPGSAEGISTWQVTGDNDIRSIEKWQDGNTDVLYAATAGGVFEYYWPHGTKNVRGGIVTAQADVQDIDRATTTDGAQAVYTAANTRVMESYWFPGGNGIHTNPIA